MAEALSALLGWVESNPHWAYLGVFLIAACESLIVVGLIVPGVAMMFAVGALVAMGALDLGLTLLWAALGAIAGDGLSFWVGHYYRDRLRVVWPFRRYTSLLDRGIDFFRRHGGKSVVLARFVGPLRPIVPAVAGMLDMPPRRFLAANVTSALLWAPAYTLPGVVFGASLALAAEVAGRLAALLAIALCLLWFGLWLVRGVIRFLQPRAGMLIARVLHWSRRHRLFQPLAAAVLDPAHPEARGLAALLALLALAAVAATWLSTGLLAGLDVYLHAGLQQLRNPAADRAMVLVSEVGDDLLALAVLATGALWLLTRRRLNAALHWLAAGVAAALLTLLLRLVGALPRALEAQGTDALALLGGHVSVSIAVYGFLAVLVTREISPNRRWIAYVAAALFAILLAFSRLYLGAQWLSEVLVSAALGLACVALFGIAYRRHPARAVHWPALCLVVAGALAVIGGLRVEQRFESQLFRHAQAREPRTLELAQWLSTDWAGLAALRHDFRARGRQSLRLQYTGALTELHTHLLAQGWRSPPRLSLQNTLLWLSPEPELADLPVPPQVHDGQYDVLRLVRKGSDGTLYILRIWPTRWQVGPSGLRLWLGSIGVLELRQRVEFLSYAVTGPDDEAGFSLLRRDLAAGCVTTVRTRTREEPDTAVLLVRDCFEP